ncbi:MAG: hypothetical protein OCC45_14240 [Desulfotalea sp.]
MSNEIVNVVCMKWGTLYDHRYVNRLYSMVQKFLDIPFKFYCITDDNTGLNDNILCRQIPEFDVPVNAGGPWKKLLMFQSPLFDIVGKTMFLDLDVVIVGQLDRFFTHSEKFSVRHEFDKRKENDDFGNTSMYVFEAGSCSELYDNYLENQQDIHKQYWTAEQEYVTRTLHKSGKLEFLPNEWMLSFKEHCLPPWPQRWWKDPILPEGVSIIAFHGRPLPEDAIKGEWPLEGKSFLKAIYKHVRPCKWIGHYWQD